MLTTVSELSTLIESGKKYFLAGEESLLKQIPQGNWIGGTTPYFMDEEGGKTDKDRIQVIEVPQEVIDINIKVYNEDQLSLIPSEGYEHGFSFVIIPGLSRIHINFAQNAPSYKDMFMKTILGWVSGVHLIDLDKFIPKVFNGITGECTHEYAVVMHCKLPKEKTPIIKIINLFEQKDNSDIIMFNETSFTVKDCLINGKKTNFSEYLTENNIDTRLPLVSDYSGTMINVSFRENNTLEKQVMLYAPVFSGVKYKVAKPIHNYVEVFDKKLQKENVSPLISFNCIVNYLHGELEGKKTQGFIGPITLGEIAYQLLNQTLVYLEIK
jgi:hypothetical protein